MDILIPYKNENGSEELRYTLRSIDKHTQNNRRVFISGDLPDWCVGVYHIPDKRYADLIGPNRFIDVERKVRAFCDLMMKGEFLFMNDDMFIMRPYKYKDLHRGPLNPPKDVRSPYVLAQERTKKVLDRFGVTNLISYELHMPMMMDIQKRAAISRVFAGHMNRGQTLLMRSVYGNIFDVGGKKVDDCKDINEYTKSSILSTSHEEWGSELGEYIRSKFNKECQYER